MFIIWFIMRLSWSLVLLSQCISSLSTGETSFMLSLDCYSHLSMSSNSAMEILRLLLGA